MPTRPRKSSPKPAADLPRLERELRKKMRAAARDYRETVAEQDKVMARIADRIGEPGETLDWNTASGRERDALEKYAVAIQEYADLVVRGRRPGPKVKRGAVRKGTD